MELDRCDFMTAGQRLISQRTVLRQMNGTDRRQIVSDTYVECLVKRRTGAGMKLLKILTVMLAALFLLIGLTLWPALVIGIVLAIAAYFVYLHGEIEYEYLYVDKELTVDKVMARSRRKKIATYDMNRLEILAPVTSWHLDSYKNRNVKAVNYGSGITKQPDVRYAMYYDGTSKIILEPSPELIKAIQMAAPRKVFQE